MIQRKTTAKRKLLAEPLLEDVITLYKLDVPLTAIIRNKKLQINRTSLRALILFKVQHGHDDTCAKSLFPLWLDNNSEQVQESPQGWAYIGRFPFGKWVQECSNQLNLS